jgi:hypothetical protein
MALGESRSDEFTAPVNRFSYDQFASSEYPTISAHGYKCC